MITKQDAVNAHYRQEFYFVNNHGVVKRCRVNGACKTWKTRPDEFKLPMKFGLYECFYITDENAGRFFTSEELAAEFAMAK